MQDRPVRLLQGWTERKTGVHEGLQELHDSTSPNCSSSHSEFLTFLDKIIPLFLDNNTLYMVYYTHIVSI